jgi:hypothetical protein
MPDYTSILRRSIAALPDSSPEMRAAVYQRARAALARQLTAVEPPLSTREIEAQHQDLEDAVARLEAEYAPEEPSVSAEPQPFREDPVYPHPAAEPRAAFLEPAGAGNGHPVARARSAEDDVQDSEDEDDFDDEERSSRVPLLVGLLLLVLVIGGIGAYAYAERGTILALLGLSDSGTELAGNSAPPVPVVTPAPEPQAVDQPQDEGADKRLDRLANGPDGPLPEGAAPADTAALEPDPAEILPGSEEDPAEVLPEEPAQGLAADEQTAALQQPAQSIVAQRAIYYFQGTENSPGKVAQGTVTWAETTREGAPAVQATLRLAEQDVATTVTIYKNNDQSLPASHLVEVQFSGKLGPTPIQRVPALVLKQTEQARGQPLTGAAVPVTGELFWIALSDDPEQVAKNLQLLREGSWFDIPILFNDGTRALLTFEKGIPGDKVFEAVMSSWTPA